MREKQAAVFISQLLRAANAIGRLTKPEQARLLEKASAMFRDYRLEIAYASEAGKPLSGAAAEWADMARQIDLFSDDDVKAQLLRAVELIGTARTIMKPRRERARRLLLDEMNTSE